MKSTTTSIRGRGLHFAAALLLGAASAALLATPAEAQVSAASLRGTITDNGQPTATQVTIVDTGSGYRRTAPVSASGQYNFPSLRPGEYRLEVTTPSGVRNTDTFTLQVAQNAQLNFDLAETGPEAAAAPGEAAADEGGTIIVTASKLQNMEGGEVGKVISQRLIEQLPQNNRNFLAFADLAPGVQFITDGGGNSRLQGGAQASSTVNVFIDGVGQKDYVLKNGVTGQDSTQGNPFPQLAIGEYRVISSNYKAEFDQVSSVAITAVTKSGTNQFHGEGFVDFTNQDLRDFRPAELFRTDPAKVKSKDFQFGGALGGPIIKDIAHFFVTYEGKRRIEPRDVTPGLSLPVSFFPEEYQGYFGPRNQEFNENLYFGKIDIAPTSRDLLEFSLKYREEYGEQFNNGIAAYDTRSLTDVTEWRGLARWQHTADSWINDFKVAYEDVSWNPRPAVNGTVTLFNATVPNPTGGTRTGDVLRFGAGSNFQNKGQKGWTVSDDFTYTALQGHTFKVGVKAKWITLNTTEQNGLNPLYIYNVSYNPDGGTFNDTIPYRVQFGAPIGSGDPRISSDNFQFGVYAQDDWDVTDRLTLNLGLRWDYERTPAFLNYVHDPAIVALVTGVTTDPLTGDPLYPNLQNADYNINDYISTGNNRKAFKGAWQPRLGFTYKLDETGRFAVFGGYGRSYDRTQFDFIQQELSQGQFAGRTFNFITGDPRNVCAPSPTCVPWDPVYLTEAGRAQLLAGAPAGGGRELRFINNDIKMPYSDQFSLGIRGRFDPIELEAGYSHVASHDGFAYLLGNRRPDGSFFPATGNPDSPFGFAPPGYGAIIIGTNGIETRADSGYLKLTKQYSVDSPWSIDATYTYTKAEENRQFGELFSLDFPSMADYPFTASSGVRKHRFVAAGTVDLPFDMALSGKFQISSPMVLKAFVNTAGTPPSRTVIATETEGNGDRWGFRQMDVSLTKYVAIGFPTDEMRVRFRLDIINLFNDRNYNGFDALTGKRQLTNYNTDGPPRTIKLSAGFSF
ncbi:TonB-dependent receptor domain-containing protein [Hephaestia sp. GCM10023244]|uniref:TonB-dependent receptor n=1 Tax=unclassified Hephaestia TaxID=2631281 RepID=UPI0020775A14|nr:TonB-dependent receptor [Hephaestia sp. MAHUQ-44]MCM8730514.1 TonB-dependent receptor [Hephaestia sp. MAHUQ-44]